MSEKSLISSSARIESYPSSDGASALPNRATGMDEFYDRLAPLYDLIFPDWDASIERQSGQLAGIIHDRWGTGVGSVLDVACGIGAQAIGLARRGFAVTASDLSAGAVERAGAEASRRGVEI